MIDLLKVRIFLRKIIHFKNKKRLDEIFSIYPKINEIFKGYPKYYNDMLCRSYGALGFNAIASFKNFKNDLSLITNKYPKALDEQILLYTKDNIYVHLNTKPKVISEGIFYIDLYYKNTSLYNFNFTILDDGVLITALQGGLDKKEEIKEFTKELFGLRPLNFIIFLAFEFSKSLGLNKVYGVKDKYLVSGFKRDRKRGERVYLIPNYDDIWKENTNILKEHKYYYELGYMKKNIEEIPSKKRSMYKKRYEFLENVKL